MANNQIEGGAVLMEFAIPQTNPNDDVYKVLVCELDSSLDGNSNVNTEKTKCGPIVSVDDPEFSFSGNAITNAKPDETQWSYKDVLGWLNAKQRLRFRYQSPADAALGLATGEAFYHGGEGFFSKVGSQATEGQSVQFSWTFNVDGNLAIESPDEEATGTETLTFATQVPKTAYGLTVVPATSAANMALTFTPENNNSGPLSTMPITLDATAEATVYFPASYLGKSFTYVDSDGGSHTDTFAATTKAFT